MWSDERSIATRHGTVAVRETAGRGAPVLFIHGNSSCSLAFAAQFDGTPGRAYRCIAFDLPGHGSSPDSTTPAADYNQVAYAEAAADVLAACDAERPAVVGWSLGGHVGIELLAANVPMRGLCIFGTPPCGPGAKAIARAFRPLPELAFAAKETFTPAEAATFAAYILGVNDPPAELVEAVQRTDGRARSAMWHHWAVAAEGCDQIGVVERTAIPLAILHGQHDPFVDGAWFERIAFASLWRGRVHTFEGTGHAPFLEQPDRFNALLGEFLEDLS